MTGGAVVTVMTGGADGDTAGSGFVDRRFGGLHHRRISQAAIATDKNRRLCLQQYPQTRIGVGPSFLQ